MKKAVLPCVVFIAFTTMNCTKDASAPVKDSKTTSEAKTTVSDNQNRNQDSHTCGNDHNGNDSGGGY